MFANTTNEVMSVARDKISIIYKGDMGNPNGDNNSTKERNHSII